MCWRLRTLAPQVVVLVSVLAGAACSHTPTAPTTIDLTGTWSGSASDTTGFGDLLWRVTQTGGTFNGTVDITDRTVNTTGRGTVYGTVLSNSVQFTLVVPSGGFDAPFNTCSTTVTGEATAGQNSLSGTYSGTSTCGGKIYSGQFLLRRP